jgi:hypothetical protein
LGAGDRRQHKPDKDEESLQHASLPKDPSSIRITMRRAKGMKGSRRAVVVGKTGGS